MLRNNANSSDSASLKIIRDDFDIPLSTEHPINIARLFWSARNRPPSDIAAVDLPPIVFWSLVICAQLSKSNDNAFVDIGYTKASKRADMRCAEITSLCNRLATWHQPPSVKVMGCLNRRQQYLRSGVKVSRVAQNTGKPNTSGEESNFVQPSYLS